MNSPKSHMHERKDGGRSDPQGLGPLQALLRCPDCGAELERQSPPEASEDRLRCQRCGSMYPVRRGTVRMLSGAAADDPHRAVKMRTARSFAYEWEQFGRQSDWWAKNFREYLGPVRESSLQGLKVLDVGAGSGRHSLHAQRAGASVVAVDIGDSIDMARANLPDDVLTVQADAEHLPFARDSFDMVMSIGVLHHLPDTAGAVRGLVGYVKPGGWLHIYLYWVPPIAAHRHLLRAVQIVRRLTTRMPHRVLHALCYPLAFLLEAVFVAPYRALRRRRRGAAIARALPLKAYADYPFSVLVNDQFDRFSAPIERRFEAEEVVEIMQAAGLTDVTISANNGWVARGRRRESEATGLAHAP